MLGLCLGMRLLELGRVRGDLMEFAKLIPFVKAKKQFVISSIIGIKLIRVLAGNFFDGNGRIVKMKHIAGGRSIFHRVGFGGAFSGNCNVNLQGVFA